MNFLILFSFINIISYFQQPEIVDITIVVSNVKTLEGNIELGIFNDSKSFLKKGKEHQTHSKEATNNTVIFYLKGLNKGDYAVSLFHDINSDNKCNLNILGRPKEPYGFSNNVKLKLFKPNYEDCTFTVKENMILTIELVD